MRETLSALVAAGLILAAAPAFAQAPRPAGEPRVNVDASALARAVQNPVADLISLPFQNNTNFGYGPENGVQNVLNIQPVVPISLNDDWNVITRTIVPVISQPALQPGEGSTFGLGATQASVFLSPARPGHIIWGVGAIGQIPTTTDRNLGSTVWGGGPTAVALTMQGPWVIGGLVNNVWSFGGDTLSRYNTMTF